MATKFKINNLHFNILNLFFLGIFIRFGLAYFFSGNVSFLFGIASNDAIGFSRYAKNISSNFSLLTIIESLDYNLYPVLLSFVYKILYPSNFIGNCFTVLLWCHSFFIINKILTYFKISKISIFISLLYFCLSPTICIFSSVTLRDFIIFYFILNLIFFILRFINKKKLLDIFMCIISISLIYYLHKQFLLLFLFFSLSLYIFVKIFLILNKGFNINKFFILSFFLFIFCIVNLIDIGNTFSSLNGFQSGALVEQTIGRANYLQSTYLIDDIFTFIFYIIRNFTLYLLEPTFYNINNILLVDLVIIFEKLFKIFVMFLFIIYFIYRKSQINNQKILIFTFLIIADLSFSLGTFNWGTAFRHQVITFGLLTFLIAFVLDEMVIKNE